MKPSFVTTPIYYINARPHIGHAYTTMLADAVARSRRLLGDDVFFMTGTDEHGQKVERAAQKAGMKTEVFADETAQRLYDLAVANLVLHSPDEVYPGPYTYKRFWFRDAAFILNVILTLGGIERTRKVLKHFAPRQRHDMETRPLGAAVFGVSGGSGRSGGGDVGCHGARGVLRRCLHRTQPGGALGPRLAREQQVVLAQRVQLAVVQILDVQQHVARALRGAEPPQ
jgi:hypothetical protein